MRNIIIVIICTLTTSLAAQDIHIWKGGTPGNESSWNEPKNWSNQLVPSEDSYVVIKALNTGHNAQPVIEGKVVIACLELQSKALLSIKKSGNLIIDGTYTYSEGVLLYGGLLFNEGNVEIYNIDIPQTKAIALQAMSVGEFNINRKSHHAK